jgi:Ca2+-binding EF-hand superfamily protein
MRSSPKPILCAAALLAVAATFAQPAWASSAMDKQVDEKFAAADVNHDGKLTLEEAKAGMPRVAKNFDKIDADKKGYITADQIKAMADKM